jgi:hypothetical protein
MIRVPRRGSSGQSTAEYAFVLGTVLLGLVAMQVYIRRGLNAKIKDSSDSAIAIMYKQLKKTAPVAKDLQYEPNYSSSKYTVTQDTTRKDVVGPGGVAKKEGIVETTTRTGSQTIEVPAAPTPPPAGGP